MTAIDLEFTNPHEARLAVSQVQVRVREVNAPSVDEAHTCTVTDFTVVQMPRDKQITIAAGQTSTLSSLGVPRRSWPRVGLVDRSVNQDGCKGASLALAYSAYGTVGS